MKSTLFWSVFLLLALIQGIAGNDNGDRISCFPLPGKIFLEICFNLPNIHVINDLKIYSTTSE